MTPEAIIATLLAIIGALLTVCVGLFMSNINEKFKAIQATSLATDKKIANLDDMFTRHVRNQDIHIQRKIVVPTGRTE